VPVALAHGVGACDGGLFNDAEELEGKIRFHVDVVAGAARDRTANPVQHNDLANDRQS